ncbi:MAG: bile acid:sodium symporter [Bacteroidota bacterium]
MKHYIEFTLLILAIIAGCLTGLYTSFDSSFTDYVIILLLFFLFYNVSLNGLYSGFKNKKYLFTALFVNFAVIPFIAFLFSTIFSDNSTAFFVGLILYLVAPCTDWYLGFTKLAKGDVEANSALLPFNLIFQILLIPVYLYIFTDSRISIPVDSFIEVLLFWVLAPFVTAQIVSELIRKYKRNQWEKTSNTAELLVLISLIILVFSIFNTNVEALLKNTSILPQVLAVIVLFFVSTFFLARIVSKMVAFSHKEMVSLTMTTAARNAPLMLMIALIFFSEEPIIQLILVIGILVEFPHLILVSFLLKKKE